MWLRRTSRLGCSFTDLEATSARFQRVEVVRDLPRSTTSQPVSGEPLRHVVAVREVRCHRRW
jgi:hypothetical protein